MKRDYPYRDGQARLSHAYLGPAMRAFSRSLPAGARIVDLGCGNGALTATLLGAGAEIHGIDGSESGIEWATRCYRGIAFRQGDITGNLRTLGLEPDSFDAVVAAEVIEHVYEPRRMASNAFELLKPGGALFLTTPYHGYLKNLVLALTGKMDAHFNALWDGGHIKFWSQKTLAALLLEQGFQEMRFSGVGRLPHLWKSMVVCASKPAC